MAEHLFIESLAKKKTNKTIHTVLGLLMQLSSLCQQISEQHKVMFAT